MFKKLLKSKKCHIFVVVILALIGICLLVNFKMIQSKENFTNTRSDISGNDISGNTSNALIDYSGLISPIGKLNAPTLLTPEPLVCSDCSGKTFWTFSSKDYKYVTVDFNDVSANDENGCRDYCNKNQPCEGWLMNPSDGKCHIFPTVGTSGDLTRSCESVSGRKWFGEVNPVVKDRLKIIDVERCMTSNCSGTIFKNDINSGMTVVPQSKTYLHSNPKACEVQCTIDRLCSGTSFDVNSKDTMKKCTIYSAAPVDATNGVKADTICSRVPPKCSVDGFELNSSSQGLLKKSGNFKHTNESACSNQCKKRDNCVGYLWDSSSTEEWKPCYIFENADSGATTGFPISGVCSKSS